MIPSGPSLCGRQQWIPPGSSSRRWRRRTRRRPRRSIPPGSSSGPDPDTSYNEGETHRLAWLGSVDPDGKTVTYEGQFSRLGDFTDTTAGVYDFSGVTALWWDWYIGYDTVTADTDTCRWRLRARDADNELSEWDVSEAFTVYEYAGPPPPEPPPPPLPTTSEYLALISAAALEVGFGAELLDENDLIIGDLSADLLGGEVERNNYADVHGTCKIQLARALDWATARIRPYQVLTGAGLSQRWYLGVYLLTTPEAPLGEDPVTYDVSGYDKLHLLQKPVGDTYVIPTGTGYLAAVRQALIDAGATGAPPLLDSSAEDLLLPAPMVWVLDPASPVSYLRVVNDLLGAIGYRGLWADVTGRYSSRPYQSPLLRPPVWTLDVTDQRTCILGESRTLTTDVYEPTNWWRFIRTGMTVQPTEGAGLYTVDLSAGGSTYKAVRALDAANQASLQSQGDAIIQTARQVRRTLEVSTGPLPLLGHFDVFNYVDPDAGLAVLCQARSHRIPLDGGDVTLTLEVLA